MLPKRPAAPKKSDIDFSDYLFKATDNDSFSSLTINPNIIPLDLDAIFEFASNYQIKQLQLDVNDITDIEYFYVYLRFYTQITTLSLINSHPEAATTQTSEKLVAFIGQLATTPHVTKIEINGFDHAAAMIAIKTLQNDKKSKILNFIILGTDVDEDMANELQSLLFQHPTLTYVEVEKSSATPQARANIIVRKTENKLAATTQEGELKILEDEEVSRYYVAEILRFEKFNLRKQDLVSINKYIYENKNYSGETVKNIVFINCTFSEGFIEKLTILLHSSRVTHFGIEKSSDASVDDKKYLSEQDLTGIIKLIQHGVLKNIKLKFPLSDTEVRRITQLKKTSLSSLTLGVISKTLEQDLLTFVGNNQQLIELQYRWDDGSDPSENIKNKLAENKKTLAEQKEKLTEQKILQLSHFYKEMYDAACKDKVLKLDQDFIKANKVLADFGSLMGYLKTYGVSVLYLDTAALTLNRDDIFFQYRDYFVTHLKETTVRHLTIIDREHDPRLRDPHLFAAKDYEILLGSGSLLTSFILKHKGASANEQGIITGLENNANSALEKLEISNPNLDSETEIAIKKIAGQDKSKLQQVTFDDGSLENSEINKQIKLEIRTRNEAHAIIASNIISIQDNTLSFPVNINTDKMTITIAHLRALAFCLKKDAAIQHIKISIQKIENYNDFMLSLNTAISSPIEEVSLDCRNYNVETFNTVIQATVKLIESNLLVRNISIPIEFLDLPSPPTNYFNPEQEQALMTAMSRNLQVVETVGIFSDNFKDKLAYHSFQTFKIFNAMLTETFADDVKPMAASIKAIISHITIRATPDDLFSALQSLQQKSPKEYKQFWDNIFQSHPKWRAEINYFLTTSQLHSIASKDALDFCADTMLLPATDLDPNLIFSYIEKENINGERKIQKLNLLDETFITKNAPYLNSCNYIKAIHIKQISAEKQALSALADILEKNGVVVSVQLPAEYVTTQEGIRISTYCERNIAFQSYQSKLKAGVFAFDYYAQQIEPFLSAFFQFYGIKSLQLNMYQINLLNLSIASSIISPTSLTFTTEMKNFIQQNKIDNLHIFVNSDTIKNLTQDNISDFLKLISTADYVPNIILYNYIATPEEEIKLRNLNSILKVVYEFATYLSTRLVKGNDDVLTLSSGSKITREWLHKGCVVLLAECLTQQKYKNVKALNTSSPIIFSLDNAILLMGLLPPNVEKLSIQIAYDKNVELSAEPFFNAITNNSHLQYLGIIFYPFGHITTKKNNNVSVSFVERFAQALIQNKTLTSIRVIQLPDFDADKANKFAELMQKSQSQLIVDMDVSHLPKQVAQAFKNKCLFAPLYQLAKQQVTDNASLNGQVVDATDDHREDFFDWISKLSFADKMQALEFALREDNVVGQLFIEKLPNGKLQNVSIDRLQTEKQKWITEEENIRKAQEEQERQLREKEQRERAEQERMRTEAKKELVGGILTGVIHQVEQMGKNNLLEKAKREKIQALLNKYTQSGFLNLDKTVVKKIKPLPNFIELTEYLEQQRLNKHPIQKIHFEMTAVASKEGIDKFVESLKTINDVTISDETDRHLFTTEHYGILLGPDSNIRRFTSQDKNKVSSIEVAIITALQNNTSSKLEYLALLNPNFSFNSTSAASKQKIIPIASHIDSKLQEVVFHNPSSAENKPIFQAIKLGIVERNKTQIIMKDFAIKEGQLSFPESKEDEKIIITPLHINALAAFSAKNAANMRSIQLLINKIANIEFLLSSFNQSVSRPLRLILSCSARKEKDFNDFVKSLTTILKTSPFVNDIFLDIWNFYKDNDKLQMTREQESALISGVISNLCVTYINDKLSPYFLNPANADLFHACIAFNRIAKRLDELDQKTRGVEAFKKIIINVEMRQDPDHMFRALKALQQTFPDEYKQFFKFLHGYTSISHFLTKPQLDAIRKGDALDFRKLSLIPINGMDFYSIISYIRNNNIKKLFFLNDDFMVEKVSYENCLALSGIREIYFDEIKNESINAFSRLGNRISEIKTIVVVGLPEDKLQTKNGIRIREICEKRIAQEREKQDGQAAQEETKKAEKEERIRKEVEAKERIIQKEAEAQEKNPMEQQQKTEDKSKSAEMQTAFNRVIDRFSREIDREIGNVNENAKKEAVNNNADDSLAVTSLWPYGNKELLAHINQISSLKRQKIYQGCKNEKTILGKLCVSDAAAMQIIDNEIKYLDNRYKKIDEKMLFPNSIFRPATSFEGSVPEKANSGIRTLNSRRVQQEVVPQEGEKKPNEQNKINN